MISSSYKGKTLSFYALMKEQKVEVPIIQRDYAQGRLDKKEIRFNFLKALFESITSRKSIKLDFIYGSYLNNSFQPLDGQQRLTTLFLLHWYAAMRANNLIDENMKVLSRFSYETRITSRDFCLALVNNRIAIDAKTISISSAIIDSNWFFLSWKKDPTIDSMLRTIDDIHTIFSTVDDLWIKLTSPESPISFYYVELENIGLTDDLYIKMNARGKLLTSFENFKAGFQKFINESKWEKDKNFMTCFASKIDTSWTDLFWHHFRKNSSIDDALMRFVASIAMIRQAVERSVSKADERAQIITSLQEEPNSVRPEHFSELAFNYLIDSFDVYEKTINDDVVLKLNFPFWRHKPRNTVLSAIVFEENIYSTTQRNSATYTQKVLFFAQTEYLKRGKTMNASNFQDWMRVARNIVSRGDIDKDGIRNDIIRSPQAFDGVINLFNELADGCEDIYQHLSNLGGLRSQFAKDQVEEEKNKARLIIRKPYLKGLVLEAEDNELLNGRIEFLLYCIDYENDVEHFDANLFEKVKNVFHSYFNSEGSLTNELRRAFLTVEVDGKYEFYNYWWSYWNIIGATKRRLIDKFRELEYYMYSEFREYFKKLVLQLVNKNLVEIVDEFSPPEGYPNWKIRLVKERELLDRKGKSNYLAIAEDNSWCYVLKSKRPRDEEGSLRIE